jgi:hypothetical protein
VRNCTKMGTDILYMETVIECVLGLSEMDGATSLAGFAPRRKRYRIEGPAQERSVDVIRGL